jgi:hypothetical protein
MFFLNFYIGVTNAAVVLFNNGVNLMTDENSFKKKCCNNKYFCILKILLKQGKCWIKYW